MLRFIVALILFGVLSVANANSTAPNPCADLAESTKNLTASQVQTLLESCRTPSGTLTIKSIPKTPEEATKWSEVAREFAGAIGIAAKELGVATNDFLDSPAGYMVAFILLVTFAGEVVIAMPFSLFSIWLLHKIYKSLRTEKIEYESVPILWGLINVRRKHYVLRKESLTEGSQMFLILCVAAMLGINIVVWFAV